MNKILSVIIIAILLSGCSLFEKREPVKPIVVEHRVKNIKVFHPPFPDKLDLEKVEWKVLTPEIMKEYIEAYEKGEAPVWIFYGLSVEGYKSLSHNMAELKRVLKGQKSMILYYREHVNEVAPVEVTKPTDNK